MAKVAKNLILHGASGQIGDMVVIRQVAGRTILSAAPGKRDKEPTEAQKAQQDKFQRAVLYGKSQMANPETKAEYETKAEGMKSGYNVAVADFLHAPDIDEINVSNYTGAIGDPIIIRAIDDFKVVEVHVSIINGDGTLIEEGNAVQQENILDWVYTATVANDSLEGDKIIVTAMDKPGNIKEAEETIT